MKAATRALWRTAAALILAAGMAQAASIGIVVLGETVGTLDVSTYSGGKNAGRAEIDIIANFTTAGQTANGQKMLDMVAPLGTTYLQTVKFTTDQQQQIFRTAGGANLTATFADPPQGGYMLRDGTVENFGGDQRPWYSTINPSGVKGDIPPSYAGFGGNQFQDTPGIGFAPNNGINGLAGVLNGQNGSIEFDTVLVGVCNLPGNALNGTYNVCVLGQFYWGFNFTYTGAGLGAAPFNIDDYDVALRTLTVNTVQTVSAEFASAFDRAGANAAVEWKVNFTPADACPEPATYGVAGAGLALLVWLRRRRAA